MLSGTSRGWGGGVGRLPLATLEALMYVHHGSSEISLDISWSI